MLQANKKIDRREATAFFAGIIGLLVMLAAVPANATPTTGPTTPPANFFSIGVYRQPVSTFKTWKARGINTVIDFYAPGRWQENWTNTAVADGLWMIRNPRADLQDDVNQPYLLAWSFNDEPDINNVSPASLAATYAKWKAADPNRQIIVNLSAANAIYQLDSLTDAMYKQYTASATIISSDVYPVTAYNRPQWIDKKAKLSAADPENASTTPFNPGQGVDKLRALSDGKTQYAYIETSYQNNSPDPAKGARGATAAEVRGETWDAIIQGARGIVYFPFTFPNNNDGTPASVVAGITRTDALIKQFGAVLNSDSLDDPNTLEDLPGGLEATYRDYDGIRYFFVLNFSHTATDAKFALPGIGTSEYLDVVGERRIEGIRRSTITDSFSPYQLHIYETTAVPSDESIATSSEVEAGAAVPEPVNIAILGMIAAACMRRRRRIGRG
jgi:hypothetical protein